MIGLRGYEKCDGIIGHATVAAAAAAIVKSFANGKDGNGGGADTRLDKILSIEKFETVELKIFILQLKYYVML